jgi:F-type H+-transporting ATPase subunit b
MRRVGLTGLVLAACVAFTPARLRAEGQEGQEGHAKLEQLPPDKLRDRLNDAVKEKKYHEAEEILEALKKKDPGAEKPPDRDIFGFTIDLAVWTLVVFLVLLVVLGRFAWPKILQGLEQRERSLAQAAEDARQAREEAQKLRGQLQQDMAQAREDARATIEDAKRRAQENADTLVAKAKTEIQTERERQRREIEVAHDQALKDIWTRLADLATVVAGKAINRELSGDDHRRLVDQAVTEVRQAAEKRRAEIEEVQT